MCSMLPRLGPPLAIAVLAGPILFGLAGTILPAFGYLPALGGTGFTLAHAEKLLTQPGIMMSALISLAAGLVTTAVSLGVVMLFIAGWAGTHIFSRIQHLVSPLLSVPHAAAAFGLAFLIAPSGMIARMLSPWLTGWERPPDLLIVNDPTGLSMIAGLIVKEIPFLLLIALAALPQVDLPRTRALAASLGYGRVAGFLHGVWPPLYRQMRLAVFAVVAFATSVVDVAAILGPTTPAPLAVRLVGWMNDPELSMRFFASAGALLQLCVSAAALLIWIALERLGAAMLRRLRRSGLRFRRDAWLRRAALAAMVTAAMTVLAGLATLAIWSFAGLWQFPDALPETFTAKTWMKTAPRLAAPLSVTLIVAAASTTLAIALTLLCLMRENETGRVAGRRALLFLYLPLLVPQAAFLFGLQLLFVFTGGVASLPALVLAHLTFVMPYVFLSLSDPWRAYDRRYEAIAAGLGKSRIATLLRVRLPMLSRAILVAAAVGFAVSVGQYLPTVLIGAGRLETITTEAVALASGGNRRVIGVYAFLQMLLPAAGFAVATLVPALVFRNRRAMRV
ncbi:ABC transporter permease [Allomesorhizobium camelthorni]